MLELFEWSIHPTSGGYKEARAWQLLRQECDGLQHRKLNIIVRFYSSTKALDKLDADTVSLMVS